MTYVMTDTNDPTTIETMAVKDPFGPKFDAETAAKADRLVIRGTTFSDPGEYVEFELSADGKVLATRRIGGY